ncbi:MAG: ABC transporter ATP-binding protein/permease [Acidobacteriota bacterium]|jgi:subfamily B ATP-binding cassette protein MsbA|nr:ABC transporter ATP-binding protein/permease [Acidobacteriota bacterium]
MKQSRRLYQLLKPHLGVLALAFALLLGTGCFEILVTSLVIPLFDKVLTATPTATTAVMAESAWARKFLDAVQSGLSMLPGTLVTQLALALVGLTFLKGACLYYSNYAMGYVGQRILMELRTRLFAHVLRQSMSFFSLNSTGKLMSRVSSDVEQLQEAVSTTLGEFFREAVMLAALVCYVLILDWRLALLAVLVAPLAGLLTMTMGRRIRAVSLKWREDAAVLNDHLQQSITGMRIIKAFGMEAHEEGAFARKSLRLLRSNLKAMSILFLNSPAMELLGVVAFIPLLYYAHRHIADRTVTLGLFGGVLFTLFRMYDPIRKLSRIHVQYQRAMASWARIMELLDADLEVRDRPGARRLEGVRDSVSFKGVGFSYPGAGGEAPVLDGIDLEVGRNQVVALVGSSGSGKTTLAGLLPRFYDPTEGAVLIDGVDIREFTQASLRRQMAMVTQETFLFNDTVYNNIAYGDVGASRARVEAAAKAALADDFIRRFPEGYETVIGERGQRLSGGERQRISIARALLKDAPVLILDEATSALDSESEQLVQAALANLIKDRTTFVIAHRLSTIRNADLILVLERGRVVERGGHGELMARGGHYRRFFDLQSEPASR